MQYDLVFEGGGAKGIAFGGALKEFYGDGNTHGRLMGTSAGAITACLLAAGYQVADIDGLITERLLDGTPRFAEFTSTPVLFSKQEVEDSDFLAVLRKVIEVKGVWNPFEQSFENTLFKWLEEQSFFPKLFSPLEKGYLYTDDAFLRWLRDKLNAQYEGLGMASFTKFAEVTGSDLTVIASDVTDNQLLILNQRTAPQCVVADAVRMSMSVPFVWQPVTWRAEWGGVQNRPLADHLIVDGGIISNFPIELFLTDQPQVTQWMGDISDNVLGLMIDETTAVPNAPAPPDKADNQKLEAFSDLYGVQQLHHIFDTMLQAHDNRAIGWYADKIIQLPAKDYGTLEFDMQDDRREALVIAARQAMRAYLDREIEFETTGIESPREMIDKTARALLGIE